MTDLIRVCVFDACGTLFDVHSAMARHAVAIGDNASGISKLWRSKQLEYSWVHSLMGRHIDFRHLTEVALEFALRSYGVEDQRIERALCDSYLMLDAYPEVVGVLQGLQRIGLTTAILSNGSPDMLLRGVQSAGIDELIEVCLSIEKVGIYKPHRAAYELATSSLDTKPSNIAFFSSNAWDAIGAHTFGFRTFWVNRRNQLEEYGLYGKVVRLQALDAVFEHIPVPTEYDQ
jgi:2-haloacid dehalogenase